jgi:biopolymer transport protein ExbD/biopolymer transport protein TolR
VFWQNDRQLSAGRKERDMAIVLRNEDAKINSNINVTPMVDVMLVLLIIFMVITPMLHAGVPVDLAETEP